MKNPSLSAFLRERFAALELRNYEDQGRYYHSLRHTLVAFDCVCDYEPLIGLALTELLAKAIVGHDYEQSLGSGENERISAEVTAEAMRRHGFGEDEVQRVINMILGTEVYFENGIMHQKAESMGREEKLLADADLCSLGAKQYIFVDMSLRLMAEFAKKPMFTLTREDLRVGWENQVKFMEGRQFLTPEAEMLMGAQFRKNLEEAKRRVKLNS